METHNIQQLAEQDLFLLHEFDISRYGFLTDPHSIPIQLPNGFEEYNEVVEAIEDNNGLFFRSLVNALEKGKPQKFYYNLVKNLTFAEKKQVYSLFTFVVQKYIRCMGINDTPTEIPYELGIVWSECAKEFNLPCVTSYAATILYNCIFDPSGNIESRHAISGTNDELHFYKVHMKIEACGANVLKSMYFLDTTNKESIMRALLQVDKAIKRITELMRTMYDGCDPEVFWINIRHYLGGFTERNGLPNGLKVKDTNMAFKFDGGSAAQSTLIQAFDIFLGVSHGSEHGSHFLLEQRNYMPVKHHDFLKALEHSYPNNFLKNLISEFDDEEMTTAFNKCISSLKLFRQVHYDLVHKYVIRFITGNAQSIHGKGGTGGLPTEKLIEYIDNTQKTKLIIPIGVGATYWATYWHVWLACLCLCFAIIFVNNQ